MIKFKHIQNTDSHRKNNGICICYEYDHKTSKLSFSIAQCHRKDAYNKKEGRDVALDNFMKGNKLTIRVSASAYKHKKDFLFNSIGYDLNYYAY